MAPGIVLGAIGIFLLVFLVLPAIDAVTAPPDDAARIADAEVPNGVSAWTLDERRIFLVRDGDRLTAFLAYATHLDDEPIWWCPTLEAFVSPMHGEAYDVAGRILFGPAQRALDRLTVERDGGDIVVFPEPVATGLPVEDERAHAGRPWEPVVEGEFCPGAVE